MRRSRQPHCPSSRPRSVAENFAAPQRHRTQHPPLTPPDARLRAAPRRTLRRAESIHAYNVRASHLRSDLPLVASSSRGNSVVLQVRIEEEEPSTLGVGATKSAVGTCSQPARYGATAYAWQSFDMAPLARYQSSRRASDGLGP